MSARCETCDRPLVPKKRRGIQWVPDGDGCIGPVGCTGTTVDWRARCEALLALIGRYEPRTDHYATDLKDDALRICGRTDDE